MHTGGGKSYANDILYYNANQAALISGFVGTKLAFLPLGGGLSNITDPWRSTSSLIWRMFGGFITTLIVGRGLHVILLELGM